MNEVILGDVPVGSDHPPYIIAEIGSNHNGDMDLCRDIIDAAVRAGASAVKFQSWTEESLISDEEYEANTEYADTKKHFGTLREMVREYEFTPEQHREIQAYCAEQGIVFSSSSFSAEEADMLDEMGVPFFKMASMDINNLELLDHVARKGKPMIVSTGMASLGEIESAVQTVHEAGNDQLVLLHCVAVYPPDMHIMNLRNIDMLRKTFDVPVGFSDHTLGTTIPLAAIARGACVVEKHFTIDKDLPGWDHAISANEEEMRTLVEAGNDVYTALGTSVRQVSEAEIKKRRDFRRSAIAQRSLSKGDVIRREDIAFKRPGDGVRVDEFEYVEGRELVEDVEAGHVIRWKHLRGDKE